MDGRDHASDVVSLREFVEQRMQHLEAMADQRHAAQQMALETAAAALRQYLAGMNEFRDTLRDQAARFVTVDVLDAKWSALDARLKQLELRAANTEGKLWTVGALAAIISFLISAVGFALNYYSQ